MHGTEATMCEVAGTSVLYSYSYGYINIHVQALYSYSYGYINIHVQAVSQHNHQIIKVHAVQYGVLQLRAWSNYTQF